MSWALKISDYVCSVNLLLTQHQFVVAACPYHMCSPTGIKKSEWICRFLNVVRDALELQSADNARHRKGSRLHTGPP